MSALLTMVVPFRYVPKLTSSRPLLTSVVFVSSPQRSRYAPAATVRVPAPTEFQTDRRGTVAGTVHPPSGSLIASNVTGAVPRSTDVLLGA